ncbi:MULTISPECIES: glycosyltransferase [unclassified Fibrobacter]|uniref:glycosyltransferase n=1 Tax=unclassified Fibrobacter TaxID=2634177 RepID=UPI000D6C6641|nr:MULTISPECIES: glycosyltransferase [unclassified Fibrobacter]PWJ70027.1 glycosyltransferase involved in cell wall biosynthesis [Fibrobacter sp. UWR4]PZW73198.1 glycosyltransferase involved in cell wall biosynthesis [Fibrobacter sp. UWR1]
MKKILFVCDKNECTSFGRLTLNLIKAVTPEFEAHVLWLKTPKFFPDAAKSAQGAEAVVPSNSYTSQEVWAKSLYTGFFSFRSPLKKVVGEVKPDVVFFIRPELGFLVPVAKSALKSCKNNGQTVMFVHDTFAETLYPTSPKFILLNLFYIRSCVNASSFVYNSEWTRGEAAKHFGPKMANAKGSVIGCPVDQDLFNKPEEPIPIDARKAFRRKHGMRNFDGMCINVSLDEPRKNIDTYFETARLRPDVAFVRVGKQSERLREIINVKKLYNVFHLERLNAEELRDFYRHADLMVYPSLLEGFGLPPIEAIACGTPALCAATSAVKENLDGVCPLIDPPTDAEAYAKVIDRVIAGENVVDKEKAAELLSHCSMKSFKERVLNALA